MTSERWNRDRETKAEGGREGKEEHFLLFYDLRCHKVKGLFDILKELCLLYRISFLPGNSCHLYHHITHYMHILTVPTFSLNHFICSIWPSNHPIPVWIIDWIDHSLSYYLISHSDVAYRMFIFHHGSDNISVCMKTLIGCPVWVHGEPIHSADWVTIYVF